LVSVFTEYNYVGDVFVDLSEYITHCDRILRGLETLQALQDAGLTNFSFEGLQIYDHTRRQPSVISAREMAHTFRREFRDSMTAYDEGMREIE